MKFMFQLCLIISEFCALTSGIPGRYCFSELSFEYTILNREGFLSSSVLR